MHEEKNKHKTPKILFLYNYKKGNRLAKYDDDVSNDSFGVTKKCQNWWHFWVTNSNDNCSWKSYSLRGVQVKVFILKKKSKI